MTSIQGTDTSYSCFSDSEFFLSSVLNRGIGSKWYKQGEVLPSEQLTELKYSSGDPVAKEDLKKNKEDQSLLELLRDMPDLSIVRSLVNMSGWNDVLDNNIVTFIAPLDVAFKLAQIKQSELKNINAYDTLRFLTIKKPIYASELKNRVLRVRSEFKGIPFDFIMDGRKGLISLNDQKSNILNPYEELYSAKSCRIVKIHEARNGILYVVDNLIVPYLIE